MKLTSKKRKNDRHCSYCNTDGHTVEYYFKKKKAYREKKNKENRGGLNVSEATNQYQNELLMVTASVNMRTDKS